MKIIRNIYRTARGILFTAIILVAVVYLALYVLLSVPSFQNRVKTVAEEEVSKFIGGKVEIDRLFIKPFNEVVVNGLKVYEPTGRRCLYVQNIGAGVDLFSLLRNGKIELTYGEIIGLNANIRQAEKDSPLNIQFLIDAFKPKDKNKPPTKFDLRLRNVVLRKCEVTFDREWIPVKTDSQSTDFNHLRLWGLKADVNIPRLANDDFTIDLRRLAFELSGGLEVEKIAFRTHITSTSLSIENFILQLPGTELRPSDIKLKYSGFNHIGDALKTGRNEIVMIDNQITPSDFGWLVPGLRQFDFPLLLSLEVAGNASDVRVRRLAIDSENGSIALNAMGEASGLSSGNDMEVTIDDVKLEASQSLLDHIQEYFPIKDRNVSRILGNVGDLNLSATGVFYPGKGKYEADARLLTSCGDVSLSAKANSLKNGAGSFVGEVSTERMNLGSLLGDQKFGNVQADVTFSGELHGKDLDADLNLYVAGFEFSGVNYDGIVADVSKKGQEVTMEISVSNAFADAEINADGHIEGEESWLNLRCDLNYIHPSMFGVLPQYGDSKLSARLTAALSGNNLDNVLGDIRLNDVEFTSSTRPTLMLDHLSVKSEREDDVRTITLKSDWIDGWVKGSFKVMDLPGEIQCMLSKTLPSLIACPVHPDDYASALDFSFTIQPDNSLPEFLNLPFRFLVAVPVTGSIDGLDNSARIDIDIPYLQQGQNKLVRDTNISADLDGTEGTVSVAAETTFPVKNGDMTLVLHLFGQDDDVFTDLNWHADGKSAFSGSLSLGTEIWRNELSHRPEVRLDINPSGFDFGTAHWNIDKSSISFVDNNVKVNGLKIWHDSQFVEIDGVASASTLDSINVKLAYIDVDYIFETLNINYVSFGGEATGELMASGAFSPAPVAYTDNLSIKNLSYNGTVLGDGLLRSRWNNEEKEVEIKADITGAEQNVSKVYGGIWVTRDSLAFDIDAVRVPVGFMQPFVGAFSSDVRGTASGNVKLFGTFSDIDLVGKVLADSISMKLDYTNVYYSGTDSIYFDPGKIIVPSFRLHDRDGHSGVLSGELTHRYFHDPRFNFKISEVHDLLCYDTDSKINPDWYGTIYGRGSAVVKGWPGTVSVSVDMTAVGNSRFTFVLNDTQAAEDYKFLTFSDRRKEEAERLQADSVPDVLAAFQKKMQINQDVPTKFQMDIRASVSPSTLMTLVMDPVAGDKITARGNGNIQVDYDSESDEMQMFGKYILEEGNYNFSLQDLILRDFTIRQGSSISFNGDPLNANLDITASYRVNTNLSDLDKSFSTDRDLARTNVPVDALLMVEGAMQHPDISFDIELPTLTQDVERKVKSIISTDDMMSRQIIYLLALNRFYTPEYMGATSNGGELAAVASSTLSSQLSNMLGQLTDKFTLAPSFRSDKGDFSDLEVDVALSSRLLNNRLLVNGNFGYRDRATSQTTFIGDFDLEYLLSRNGNLRLKAYNHFNDQNYYLRQALTTQGLGVVYRRDFDNLFDLFRKRRKDKKDERHDSLHDGKSKTLPDTIP